MGKYIDGQWVEDEENKEESAELKSQDVSYNAPKLSDNAEAFEEWKNNNADYQSLVKNYANAGDNAAKDVIAQISARTGGYASSYAARAATNAAADAKANAQLQLQEIARSRYNEDVADARNRVASFIAGGGDPDMIDDNILRMSGYSRGELHNTATKSAKYDTVAANAGSRQKDYGKEDAISYINDMVDKGYITDVEAAEILDVNLGGADPTFNKKEVKFINNDGADRWDAGDNITIGDDETEYKVQIARILASKGEFYDDVKNDPSIQKNDVFSKDGKLYLWTGDKLYELEPRTNNVEKRWYNPVSWFSSADDWNALKKLFGDIG